MKISLVALLVAGVFLPASPPAPTPTSPGLPAEAGGPALTVAPQEGDAREPIDVNSASAEELQEVPGIGPAIARRIVEFRQEHGRLERLEDLLHVRGIGSKTLERLRPYLTVDDEGSGESGADVDR